ncbi:MAG: HEAT repeat domain-containing protein [Desulfocapsaceae bacterium]|nr:HEAT repeat domain-containing protein [Desulfocapsaceae bacterium]
MSYRKTKAQIIQQVLDQRSWRDVQSGLDLYSTAEKLHALFSALCYGKERIKWHAVSAFGVVVTDLAEQDMEAARVVMRRFLWTLNDESGGIGWGVPEAMGEVMALSDRLFAEYENLLLSYTQEDGPEPFQDGNYLELPALQRGVLWGVGRVLSERKNQMKIGHIYLDLQKYLDSPDRIVRALAGWSLGICGHASAIDKIEQLTNDHHEFNLYWDYHIHKVSVASLAKQALQKLK